MKKEERRSAGGRGRAAHRTGEGEGKGYGEEGKTCLGRVLAARLLAGLVARPVELVRLDEVGHERADGLLAQLQSLQQKTLEILARAEGTGDLRSALAALRELRGTVELTAKLTRPDGWARRSE